MDHHRRTPTLPLTPLTGLLAPLVLAACASAAEPPPAAPPRTALDTLRAGGDYAFVLDESDPAARIRAQCASEHAGDAAAADACYAQFCSESAHEGLRFSVDAQGRLVWRSYGIEDGREVAYLEGPLAASSESERVVAAKFAEAPHGLQAQAKPVPTDLLLRFQLVDNRTVVMTDPHKGKLVFRRAL